MPCSTSISGTPVENLRVAQTEDWNFLHCLLSAVRHMARHDAAPEYVVAAADHVDQILGRRHTGGAH